MATTLLTIGRLGTRAGIEPKTLRYYDRVGLVRPASRTPAGYRVYDEEILERLHFIRRAKALGMSLADIGRVLSVRDEGVAPCRHVLELVKTNLTEVETQLRQLGRLRSELRRLHRTLKEKVPLNARSAAECPCFAIIKSFEKPATRRRSQKLARLGKESNG